MLFQPLQLATRRRASFNQPAKTTKKMQWQQMAIDGPKHKTDQLAASKRRTLIKGLSFMFVTAYLYNPYPYTSYENYSTDATSLAVHSVAKNEHTRFKILVDEMKQRVEDHCSDMARNATFLDGILETAWLYKTKPWMEGQIYPFNLLINKIDAKQSFGYATAKGHIGQIVDQMASTIRQHLTTNTTSMGVFDVGVNYGWVTFSMASMGVDVYSFEPMQSNVDFLRTALCLSPPEIRSHVTLFDFGLSDKEQECMIISYGNNIGDGQVICHESKQENFQIAGRKLREIVKLRRLDDVLPLEGEADSQLMSKIVMVKMDTEGHEPFLVYGAKNFFTRFKPPTIHSEFNNVEMTKVHADAKGMMSFFFEELGYQVRENRQHHMGRMGSGPLSKDVALNIDNFNGLHDLIFEVPPS